MYSFEDDHVIDFFPFGLVDARRARKALPQQPEATMSRSIRIASAWRTSLDDFYFAADRRS
jgi:hypothetical protein